MSFKQYLKEVAIKDAEPTDKVDFPFDYTKKNITSLVGLPPIVDKHLTLNQNSISSFEGFPKEIKGGCGIHWNLCPADFKDFPKTIISGNFQFDCKNKDDAFKCKNLGTLFKNITAKSVTLFTGDDSSFVHFFEFDMMLFSDLMNRKEAGEDIEELFQEGAQWCASEGFPSEFWGEE